METMPGERTPAAYCWGKRRAQESFTARDNGELELGTWSTGLVQGRQAGEKTRHGRAEKRAAACREHGWRGATEQRRTMDGTPRELSIGAASMGEQGRE
jgi:hypothetical protein